MLRSVVFILFAICCLNGRAEITEPHYFDLFHSGNTYYKSGQYDSAKSAYAEIINDGFYSPELCYNYGNTFFKTGNIPAAILYYERALRLDPNFSDARHNLKISNTFIADNIEPIDQLMVSAWWDNISKSMSPDSWGFIVFFLLCFGCTGVAIYLTARTRGLKQVGFFGAVVAFAMTIVVFSIAQNSKSLYEESFAIVFTPSVNVKSEPTIKSTVQFVIHEGLKVKVVDSEGDWTRIKLLDGNSGWIQTAAIEII